MVKAVTKKYEITLMGCDDYTTFNMMLTPEQLKFLKRIEKKSAEVSKNSCMPVLELRKL